MWESFYRTMPLVQQRLDKLSQIAKDHGACANQAYDTVNAMIKNGDSYNNAKLLQALLNLESLDHYYVTVLTAFNKNLIDRSEDNYNAEAAKKIKEISGTLSQYIKYIATIHDETLQHITQYPTMTIERELDPDVMDAIGEYKKLPSIHACHVKLIVSNREEIKNDLDNFYGIDIDIILRLTGRK